MTLWWASAESGLFLSPLVCDVEVVGSASGGRSRVCLYLVFLLCEMERRAGPLFPGLI